VIRAAAPESQNRRSSLRIRGYRPSREFQPHRASDAFGGWSKLPGLAWRLGAALIVAALTVSAQGQTSVTLAWNPGTGTDVITNYNLYYGAASATYTNVVPARTNTTVTVSNLVVGTTYYFAATAVDTNGLESAYSSEVAYTNPVATLPTIALTSPTNGASYTAPASVSLAASVTANGHTITKVQFYNGATPLDTVASAPYSFTWTNVSTGSYSVTAQAVYDSGSTVSSAAAGVTVNAKRRPRLGIGRATGGTGNSPEVVPPPSQAIILSASGGNVGDTYNILSSPDLQNWTSIGTMTLDSTGCCQFTNAVGAGATIGFYQLQGQ
jgi:hypothetical protein